MSKKLKNLSLLAATIVAGVCTTSVISYAVSQPEKIATTTSQSQSTQKDGETLVDETVYVFAENNGNIRKIVKSDWKKNANNEDEYSKTEDTNKTAPIAMKISYQLDGKDISAKDLAGKSGKVTIKYTFSNNERIGGYYMPYVVLTGLILDNNSFSNISVTNGKVLNDGSRTIIAGVTMPGMQENLGISKSTLDIPSSFELTADAKNFSLDMTLSIASSKVFSELNLDSIASISDLESQLGKLSDAMSQLVGGSSDLSKGIETLYNKVKYLPDSINALVEGSQKLSSGAKKLDAGVDELATGINTLYTKINENFISQNETLQNGAIAFANAAFDSANNTVVEAPSTKLSDVINGYCGTFEITSFNFNNYGKKLQVAPDTEMTCMELIVSQNDAAGLAQIKGQLDNVYAFYNGVINYTGGVAQVNQNIGQILTKVSDETEGLKAGSAAISKGSSDLSNGITTLQSSSSALLEGVGQLKDGSAKLADGVRQFNNEGIQKLIGVYNNDISGLISRIKTIVDLSKNNKSNTKYIYRTDEIE